MKYNVGDKVKYDSGDWWFYGTVGAIIENSINPCYRLNIERMEKKNCKFSITQFEFELEVDNGFEDDKGKHKWETSEAEYVKKYYEALKNDVLSKETKTKPEPVQAENQYQTQKQETIQEKVELPQEPKEMKQKRVKGEAWERNYEQYRTGERSNLIFSWVSQNRRMYNLGKLSNDKYERLKEINFPFEMHKKGVKPPDAPETEEAPKMKKSMAWYKNLEIFCTGKRNGAVNAWISSNRRDYKTGKLTEEKFQKLIDIDFPFEVIKKKDHWDRQLDEWVKGDRRSKLAQQWRQRSIRQYVDGKLSMERISKLKEVGILK